MKIENLLIEEKQIQRDPPGHGQRLDILQEISSIYFFSY